MKKGIFYGLLALVLAIGLAFTGCGGDSGSTDTSDSSGDGRYTTGEAIRFPGNGGTTTITIWQQATTMASNRAVRPYQSWTDIQSGDLYTIETTAGGLVDWGVVTRQGVEITFFSSNPGNEDVTFTGVISGNALTKAPNSTWPTVVGNFVQDSPTQTLKPTPIPTPTPGGTIAAARTVTVTTEPAGITAVRKGGTQQFKAVVGGTPVFLRAWSGL